MSFGRTGGYESGQRRRGGLRFSHRVAVVTLTAIAMTGVGFAVVSSGGASGSQSLASLLGGLGGLGGKKATATTTTTTAPWIAETSTVSQSTTSDGQDDCGGVTQYQSNGQPWVCTFDDEFDGTSLNTTDWNVETTASNGFHSGNECYMNSPNNVSVSGGALHLTLAKSSAFLCTGPGTDYETTHTAGEVYSTFSQTYGMFQIKAAFPSVPTDKVGLQTSLWLWPVNEDAYGSKWPASGEIDIAEWYSEYSDLAIPYIHYNEATTDPNVTNDSCEVSDPAEYNIYGLVWTSTTLTVTMDGKTCLTDQWNPASPEVAPEPFNLPFFMILTAAAGITKNALKSSTPLPATSDIDWVRVWSAS